MRVEQREEQRNPMISTTFVCIARVFQEREQSSSLDERRFNCTMEAVLRASVMTRPEIG